ncbi:Di-and tricarboxylate transporter [Cyclobacterium lianum]|uniref:Di-and tricarboxylate transporter n=1 Tax=Cyclobacterium lianum TaxID=388280 RepID=A0A1M7LKD5_9BACT|nr:SLC13 family permease [Cyclobacterium lianum]SHM78113.1 Di-and tricarboxylate transporter [Cyclobacterium lianum]
MEEIIVFAVLGLSLVFFTWGKIRYDLVALLALLSLAILGLVPFEKAFLGFGHPAVITVAAVLIVSKSLEKSGIVNVIVRVMDRVADNMTLQVASMSGIVALLSGFMNNVGALAIFMPVAIQIARKNNYPPSLVLMPIAFSSLLGGLTTLIGTPPNIIIAAFRSSSGVSSFDMFDFTPVGVSLAVAGVLFISLVGWRLLPARRSEASGEDLFQIKNYITEVRISSDSNLDGKNIYQLTENEDIEVKVLGIVRNKERIHAPGPFQLLQKNDILILESSTADLKELIDNYDLHMVGHEDFVESVNDSTDITITEGIIQANSPLIGQTAANLHMRSRFDVNLLALSRGDRTIVKRIDHEVFRAGDVLMLQMRTQNLSDTLDEMKCLPLASRSLDIGKPKQTFLAIGIFVAAIISAVGGWLPVEIAFTLAAIAMVMSRVLPLKDFYTSIDWPVIVLLAAMIPVGEAFETSGAANSVTELMLVYSDIFPAWSMILVIMLTTMMLSALINNAATVVLMAPIGLQIAQTMELSADPFLMSIAIGASASFLTPIGHQSNTLVMGPGGYRFSDYLRPGLPLTLLVLALGVPLILWIWPL